MNDNRRIVELDGLRGLAVWMVLGWHFLGSLVDRSGPVEEAIRTFTIFGRTGVDLFFVLSGFLIVGRLIDNRSAPNAFRVFYWRRFLRIWPPYLALIVAYWLCYLWVGETGAFNTSYGVLTQLLAQLTFKWDALMAVTNSGVAAGFAVTWSVAIEEWFYLLAPPIIFAFAAARLPVVLLVIGTASLAGRIAVYCAFPTHDLAPYVLTPLRLDGLCVGGLVAWGIRQPNILEWSRANRQRIGSVASAFIVTLPVLIGALQSNLDWHMYIWGHTYLSLGFAALLVAVWQRPGSKQTSLFRTPMLVAGGLWSYTIYLFHPLFLNLFFILAGRERPVVRSPQDALVAAAALGATIVFSIISYRLMERPLQALGHRSRYGGKSIDAGRDAQHAKAG